jgi:predicted RNA binding protein YcfA (HicA-like mRNA interferase family)
MATKDGDIFAEAREQGWEVTLTNGSHVRLKPPDPALPCIYTAQTRSDVRGRKKLIAHMRRFGFLWHGR